MTDKKHPRMRSSVIQGCVTAVLIGASLAAPACRRSTPADKPPAPALDIGPPVRPSVVVLGDSVTAGLGLLSSQAYPDLLQERLEKDGYDMEVENGGVSGDTTAGALRRLDWTLGPNTRVLVVALGGNDALRGLKPSETHDNLETIVRTARVKGIEVVLCGMEAPPNLGKDYKDAFHQAFIDVATENRDIAFVPFLLEGVAGKPELNQADGIHPTAEGQKIIADLVYEKLKPVVDVAMNRGGGSPD